MQMHLALGFTLVALLTDPAAADAAEITVLCSNGFKAVMTELASQFENVTKHRVLVTYGVSAELKRRIDAGESFDVAVLTPALIDEAIAQGKIARDTRIILARSAIAIAGRSGAMKADLSTTEAFTRTLLASKSIAYAREGASGVYFADLVRRLGLADSLRNKIVLTSTGDEVGTSVARGSAELGVLPVSEILAVPGLEVLGRFPAEIQGYVTMVGGVSARSAEPGAASELGRFLTAPSALWFLEQRGMERP
jgi:molybdate transport system substrate-binding protein